MQRLSIIDSHTGGEPTRVVIGGFPDLGSGPLDERRERFRQEFDQYRTAIVTEPRGHDVLVGALLCDPHAPDCDFGVIFFNNAGYLGMCGHGLIGLVETLAHLDRLPQRDIFRFDTPVGVVSARRAPDGQVSLTNVPSYRKIKDLPLTLRDGSVVTGDLAYGGNWFYLTHSHHEMALGNTSVLTAFAEKIRKAINAQGYPEVDHIELVAPSPSGADARSFVLCPGLAYDRSPCGTGTSAKLACLAADGKLLEGQTWVQESICGSRFGGSYTWLDQARGLIEPTITGSAHVTAEATLLFKEETDPFCWGIAQGANLS